MCPHIQDLVFWSFHWSLISSPNHENHFMWLFMSGTLVFFLLCDVAPFMLYKESRGGAWFACLAWFHDNSYLSKRITVYPFIHPSVGLLYPAWAKTFDDSTFCFYEAATRRAWQQKHFINIYTTNEQRIFIIVLTALQILFSCACASMERRP